MASNTLGTILIELKAKTDAFERGMKSAKDLSFTTSSEIVGSLERIGKSLLNLKFNNLDQMGRSLGMIGGIAAATGVALATSVVAVAVETSKKMVEMGHDAEKAGMDIKTFTENAYAAKRAGVPIEDFTNAMSKLAKNALAAAQGNAQLQRAFQLAGTSATDANGRLRPTGDILNDIIKKYDTLHDRTLKVALAQQIMGKGGASQIPFLEKGTAAIEAFRKQADLLGVAFGPESLAAAQQFVGGMNQIKAAGEGATIQFTAGLLPALNQILSSFTSVIGKTSAMHDFGEVVGEGFKTAAKWIYEAAYALDYWKIRTQQVKDKYGDYDEMSFTWQDRKKRGVLTEDQKAHFYDLSPDQQIEEASRKLQERLDRLNAKPPAVTGDKDGAGTTGLNPEKNNYAAEEIAKMREKAQASLALAAAQLIGESSVRATSAANQADAVILQIATKASKEHKTALDAEIAAAQKKYGATVLTLTTLEQEASRQQSFNKSLKDQTLDLSISADAHKRMAEAIMQGGEALTEASIANQIDQIVRKADIQLTQDQIAALNKLKDAKRADADAAIAEAINQETFSLQNAAKATQLLINAQQNGVEAEIRARAALQADSFERQHNTTLTIEQRKALEDLYITQGRKQVAQQTGTAIRSEYDPTSERMTREEEIALAVKNGAITVEQAEAAKRDAYLREQEELDRLAMRTQKSSAGARVFLNEMARNARDMAQQTHDAFAHVWDGFDQGFRNAFRNVMMGTRTLAQGFRDLGVSILSSMVEAFAGIVARWIETHIIMGAINLIFHTQQTAQEATALGTKVAMNSAANTAMAISDAGLAAAGAFAYYSATAPEAALPLAMAQYAEGLSLAGLAAFDYGGIMPKTGVALVHQNEGVLTGPTTKMLVNVNKMVNSMDTGRLAAAGAAGGSSAIPFAPTFHIYGATDADAVADKVMSRVKRHFRTAGVSR